jgi:parallel beta-helix repeat protein
MATGIHIEDSDDILLQGNDISGFDKGVVVRNSTRVTAIDNTIIEKAIQVYGTDFKDVIEKVAKDSTPETINALEEVTTNTNNASGGWRILIKRYGTTIGKFSVGILKSVLEETAFAVLKSELRKDSIHIGD